VDYSADGEEVAAWRPVSDGSTREASSVCQLGCRGLQRALAALCSAEERPNQRIKDRYLLGEASCPRVAVLATEEVASKVVVGAVDGAGQPVCFRAASVLPTFSSVSFAISSSYSPLGR
jgi:hypothetical protein